MALQILKFEASVAFSHCHLMVGERACLMAVERGESIKKMVQSLPETSLLLLRTVIFLIGGKKESICSSPLRGGC